METPFEIVATREGSKVILALSGELDLSTAPALEAHAVAALAQRADPLVVDVSRLSFMDSSGLKAMLVSDVRARQEGAGSLSSTALGRSTGSSL